MTITKEGDWFVAKDEESGVASQGKTRAEALEMLAEAITLHEESVSEDLELEEPNAPWF
ncbi:MAG: type II toxin-antitoxin system HicB family antitoxin [Halalkalicoccus sp.]